MIRSKLSKIFSYILAQYFDDLCIWETWEYLEEKEAKKGGEQCSSLLRIFMQYTGFCPVKRYTVAVDMYPEICVAFCVLVFTWMYNYWNEWNWYFHYKDTFYPIVLDAQTLFWLLLKLFQYEWFFLRKWLRLYWEHFCTFLDQLTRHCSKYNEYIDLYKETAEW